MRSPLLPLALATAAFACALQPGREADQGAVGTPPKESGRTDPASDQPVSWRALLASTPGLTPRESSRLTNLLAPVDPRLLARLPRPDQAAVLRFAAHRFRSPPRVARCWAPGTPPELIEAYHAIEEAARAAAPPAEGEETDGPLAPPPATRFNRRWSRTATDGRQQGIQGLPITLTWSIVPDGTPIPSNRLIGDRDGPSDLRAFLARLYPGSDRDGDPREQPWFPVLAGVFENVAAQTGVRYVYEPADDGRTLGDDFGGILGVRGDIRLSGHAIDGLQGTLAYNYFPNGGDTVIDTSDEWFKDSPLRLANTLEHEHCHGLGAEHVCPRDNTKLMEPVINLNFRGIQFDDLYTLQRQYGDPAEHHGDRRDNDRVTNATPLDIPSRQRFESGWLSIDDDSDVDYYALPLARESSLTVRISPSGQRYLEGPQEGATCSAGEPFDSSSIHDLALELIAPDGSTVTARARANPAGFPEEISNYEVTEEGVHYLRVSGSEANAAQLYRLSIKSESSEADLAITSRQVIEESHAPRNARVDPDETVVMEFTVTNRGTRAARGLRGTLAGSPFLVNLSEPRSFGTLEPGSSATRSFTFGLRGGSCGDLRPLTLRLLGEEGFATELPVPVRLGDPRGLERETFDRNSTSLPTGWGSSKDGTASGWSISTIRAHSGAFSAFAASLPAPGESILLSPPVRLPSSGGVLSFRQSRSLEAGTTVAYDGGVLEVSIAGREWIDILAAGATFTAGGYNLPIDTGFDSPLGGRRSWSGKTEGFVETAIALPASLGDHPVRFRWRLAHDATEAELGWFIDDIALTTECAPTFPLIDIEVLDPTTSELDPTDTARFLLHAPLPPLANLPLTLRNLGPARLATDFATSPPEAWASLVLPAGQSTLEVTIRGVRDDEVEGPEFIRLALDPASGVVGPDNQVAELKILDSRYGSWAADTLGLEGPNRPLEDFDGDGALNLEEFAWQSDAATAAILPALNPRQVGAFLHIDAPQASAERGVRVRAESSRDLKSWTNSGVEPLPEGFRIRRDGRQRFLRLVYELAPGDTP